MNPTQLVQGSSYGKATNLSKRNKTQTIMKQQNNAGLNLGKGQAQTEECQSLERRLAA
tara:strand:+ start:87 stop:260 length:174 start_codon:yes stop_codon:yes gene_type:complete